MFVGFSAAQGPLEAMLESMAGSTGGNRDVLVHAPAHRLLLHLIDRVAPSVAQG